jgi:hypothetical protein
MAGWRSPTGNRSLLRPVELLMSVPRTTPSTIIATATTLLLILGMQGN